MEYYPLLYMSRGWGSREEVGVQGELVGRLRPLIMNESFARMRNEELGMVVRRIKSKSAAEF